MTSKLRQSDKHHKHLSDITCTTKLPLVKVFELVKELIKKTWNTMFNWSKNRFYQLNQAEAHRIFKTKISIDRKLDWINRNSGKNSFWEKKPDFLKTYLKALNIRYKNAWVWDEILSQNTSFKPNFPKNLILNNLPFF